MDVKVSIIIPIYNTEHYIEQCIRSVVEQSYKNLEIILINDGSTDDSPRICELWVRKDNRIKYICKENEGQGVARNIGIDIATGEYIIFVDSDDYIDRDLVRKSVDYIRQMNAEVCIFGYYIINDVDNYIREVEMEFKLQGTQNVQDNEAILSQLNPILCNKVFKSNLLKNSGIKMENMMCEDLLYQTQIFVQAKGICTYAESLYYYRYIRSGNMSKSVSRFQEVIKSVEKMNEAFLSVNLHLKYWKALYILSFHIFKDFLFRLHKRTDLHMTEEQIAYYPVLLEKYEACLKKTFNSYLRVDNIKSKFILIGSYSLRVIVHTAQFVEENLLRDYSASSLISMMSKIGKLEVNIKRDCSNEYRLRHIFQDIEKRFAEDTLEQADYIIMDLLEEINPILCISDDIYITESDYFLEAVDKFKLQYKKILFGEEERRHLFSFALEKFKEKLKVTEKKVVVIENYLCENHSLYYDVVEKYSYESEIKKINKELCWYYEKMKEIIPEGVYISTEQFSGLRFTHDKFPFGCKPFYYNSGYYRQVAIELIRRLEDK